MVIKSTPGMWAQVRMFAYTMKVTFFEQLTRKYVKIESFKTIKTNDQMRIFFVK